MAKRRPCRAAWGLPAAAALALAPQLLMLAAPAASSAAVSKRATPPLSIAITSMSPAYGRPGQTITVAGYVRNNSRRAQSQLTIRLESSRRAFTNRYEVAAFASGQAAVPQQPVGHQVTIARLRAGVTRWWRIKLPASGLQLTCFGVYPLSAQVTGGPAGFAVPTDPTPLPFWPAKAATCSTALRPVPEDIAWIWPLIDQPHQGPCTLARPSQPQLLDNSLAASLGRRGRLTSLLRAGLRFGGRAQLTWVIDPALLASAQLMETPYLAGGGASCGPAASYPASRAAGRWLTSLIRGTAKQPAFVTPYSDVDIAALASDGLGSSDLPLAFAQGWQVARSILHRKFDPAAAGGSTQRLLDSTVWPADGIASDGVLENIAALDRTTAVILDSSTMPPSPAVNYTPSAVARTSNYLGGQMRVLLSDNTITALLGSAQASSARPAAAFAIKQQYLGQTAMIAAEAPNLSRPIVVAPPRRWAPSAGLASELLAATISAPWLRVTSAAALLQGRPGPGGVTRARPTLTSPDALRASLLRQVSKLDKQVQLLQNIGVPGSQQALLRDQLLNRAVYAIESSAWRGPARPRARQLLLATAEYVRAQLAKLTVDSNHRVTLGGLGGNVFATISNRLSFPVRVRLLVTRLSSPALTTGAGSITIPHNGIVDVPSGQLMAVKIKVAAVNAGSTLLRIRLQASNGVALPGATAQVRVTATHYGRLALVIGAVALAIFMVASATRAIRRDPPGSGQQTAAGEDLSSADPADRAPGGQRDADAPGPAAQVSALEAAQLSTS